jgi:hypothetical protein
MIISLFMDETPLVCGSGDGTGVRTRARPAGGAPGELQHDEGDDQLDEGEHDPQARSIQVSAARQMSGGRIRRPQFVNRRILTFRTRPKAASVAMIDDPP